MDQLKQVRDNVEKYIYAGKQMTLVERIRYDNYLKNLYELIINEINNQQFSSDNFYKLFNGITMHELIPGLIYSTIEKNYEYAASNLKSQWTFLKKCLQGCMLYISLDVCYKANADERVILLFIYDAFDKVLKTLK